MCDELSIAVSVLHKFALRLPVFVKHLQEVFHVHRKASEKFSSGTSHTVHKMIL